MHSVFVFYNVENVFYPEGEKSTLHPKKWNKQRYQIKLNKISEILGNIKDKYQTEPLLIGLCEIQEQKSIFELLQNPILNNYDFIYSESNDNRGMDTALLYHKKHIKIINYQHFKFPNTRNILYCKIELNQHILHTYTLHLPSKRNLDENHNLKKNILQELKKIITENTFNSEEFIVILGDFNLNPDDKSIIELMNIQNKVQLYNPFSILYGKHQFSTFHQDKGLLFDQFILSKNFLEETSKLKFTKAEIFVSDKIKKQGKPFRTFSGTRYLGGYSDHYPIILEIETI